MTMDARASRRSGLTRWVPLAVPFLCLFLTGCPAVLVAGSVGGYIVATDERSLDTQADDAFITARVKARLLASPRVHGWNVDVDTLEGRVTLSGKVRTADEAERAERLSRKVDGVRSVSSRLRY